MKNNMKTIKRLASISAALVMAATSTMALAAFAAEDDTNTLTITTKANQATHKYSAYQVFDGTYDDTAKKLTDIKWGSGVSTEGLLNDIKAITVTNTGADAAIKPTVSPFADCTDAASVAATLGNAEDDSELAKAFASVVAKHKTGTGIASTTLDDSDTTIKGLEDGYYLVVDDGKVEADKTNNGISRYMLTTVGGTGDDANKTMTVKSDEAKVEKKVDEDGWRDLADANVGDKVKFRLAATLPSNLGDYETYKLAFHDTLDLPGFEVDNEGHAVISDVKYYIVRSGSTTETEITGLTKTNENGTPDTNVKFAFSCNDILTALKTTNSKAIKPEVGDKIIVEYQAKLVPGAKTTPDTGNDNKVVLEYSNNPNDSGEGNNNITETPEDIVSVFTYELDWSKVSKTDKTALKGAEFKLQATSGVNSGKWYQSKIEDGKTIVTWVVEESNATTLKGTGDGENQFVVPGLDKGTYFLKETKVPNGYNAPAGDGFKLEIDRTFKSDYIQNFNNETDPLTSLVLKTGAGTATELNEVTDGNEDAKTTGTVKTNIENASGTSLPSTGSIGTKIFLAGGGTLVLGAGVTLIAKKRMKNKE